MDVKNKENKFLLISLFALGIYFVGPNMALAGSKGKPTKTNINFKLFPGNYFTDYDVSASLTGTDNSRAKFTGSISEKALPKKTYMGKMAVPIQSVTEFVASNMSFGVATLNSYYSTKVNDRRFLGVSEDITTVTATTKPIPVTAKIGDSGTIGTYIDKRSFKTSLSWKLENGFNGKAKLIILNVTNKPSGVLDNTFKTTYLIQTNGKRESVELETYNDTVNIRVTLKGKYK